MFKYYHYLISKLLKSLRYFYRKQKLKTRDINNIKRFLKKNKPLKTEFELIRLGSAGDGGYLIPNDLKHIKYCYSPGVSNNSDFELDLYKQYNINSFLCDFSVDSPPVECEGIQFLKKNLSSYSDDVNTTLSDWVLSNKQDYDMILQIDIESSEYDVLIETDTSLIKQFRILIIEFHQFNLLFDRFGFRVIDSVFNKLSKDFFIVHIHPNTLANGVRFKDLEIPSAIEYTFLRKDRIKSTTFNNTFPHKFDHNKDYKLPKCFFEN